jgi:hypothetical protein
MLVYLDRNFFLSYFVFTLYLNFVSSNHAFRIIQIKMTLCASRSGFSSTTSRIFFCYNFQPILATQTAIRATDNIIFLLVVNEP